LLRGLLAVKPDSKRTSEQLLQMLSSLQKQMKDQQVEMVRLREMAALEKDAATHV